MGLNKKEKRSLRLASREAVYSDFRKLRPFFNQGIWVPITNRYQANGVNLLPKDSSNHNINERHLSQYIVASAPLHCADGWTFFSRAVNGLLLGDSNIVRHLGYYAELRAAMSLLATEGIGIFNKRHFIIQSSYTCKHIGTVPRGINGGLRTHYIVWEALKHWAGLKKSTNLINKIIQPDGISLEIWIKAFAPGNSVFSVGNSFLKAWGLDLKRLGQDRESRNFASYRPTQMNPMKQPNPEDIIKFLKSIWDICQPVGISKFDVLDRHLLRLSLEKIFSAFSTQSYKAMVENMVQNVNPTGLPTNLWIDFLCKKNSPDTHPVLLEAEKKDNPRTPHHHLQVLSRAYLLLRIATGACKELLMETDVNKDEIEFWWDSLGVNSGMWEQGNQPDHISDLWSDIESALLELKDWESQITSNFSICELHKNQARNLIALSTFERVALWGMGL